MQQLQQYALQQVVPKIQAMNAGSGIRFSELSSYPGLSTHAHSDAPKLIAECCGSSEFTTRAFGTEGVVGSKGPLRQRSIVTLVRLVQGEVTGAQVKLGRH